MFFVITFLVGFLLTAFFGPKPKIENAKAASLSDFNFPRADEGDPVPRWYGTNKFKGSNTIWQGDFESKAITKKVKTGLFSSKRQTIGYKYYVGLDLAVCLGPGFVFKRLWLGKYEIWNGCLFAGNCQNIIDINLPELFGGQDKNGGVAGQIALYCGDYDQVQDSYLISKIDNDVPAYVGVAHMVFRKFYWGNSANIEPVYVEGSYFTNSLNTYFNVMPNGLDINPVECLYDLYVNGWGNLAIDPALINAPQWRLAAQKVFNEGNGMSIIVGNSNTGADVSKQILKQINGTIFQNPSTGLFDLVLIRQDYVLADLPVLGPAQISSVNNFTKKLWNETTNRVRVKFTDRSQGYKEDTVAQADDFANIRFQKRINAAEFAFPTIFDADLANTVAARELANLNVPLYQCELTADRSEVDLLPGQPFVLNWPEYGIQSVVMRVRKMGLGSLSDGKVTFGVVQDEFASDAVIIGKPSTSTTPPADYTAKAITEINFELPYWLKATAGFSLDAGKSHFAFLATKPSVYSLGYNFVVNDGTENVEVLTREPYTPNAKLAAPLAKLAGFETGVVAEVLINNVSDASFFTNAAGIDTVRAGHGLFYLNGELLAYATAEDNGDGTWTLGEVHRALVDTAWTGGAAGDRLYIVRDQIGFLPDDGDIGGRLQDVTGAGGFSLADAPFVALAGTGRADRPYPPDYFTANGERSLEPVTSGDVVTLEWRNRNRLTNPAVMKFEDDADEVPEDGTTWVVKVEDETGTEVFSADAPTPTFDLTITDEMTGNSTVLVWAKLGDVLSYAPSPFPVTVGDFVLVDGEQLTIDGQKVTVE